MLGILGLGSHTTTYYIHEINRLFQKMDGGYSTMPFKMLNANFNDINPLLPNQFDALIPIVKMYLEKLDTLAVDNILVPNITLHQTIDQIALPNSIKCKLIHPIDIAVSRLKEFGVDQVVLFGSVYTMNANYISDKLSTAGIKMLKPSRQDQEKIDLIRRGVYDNGDTALLLKQAQNIALAYSDFPILLACTELSMLHHGIPQSFDMVELQIQEAISLYSI